MQLMHGEFVISPEMSLPESSLRNAVNQTKRAEFSRLPYPRVVTSLRATIRAGTPTAVAPAGTFVEHDGIGADLRVVADRHASQNSGSRSDVDVSAQRRAPGNGPPAPSVTC